MWYTSRSSIYPELEDTTSSAKYNYVRRNVVKIEDGLYKYEEAKVEKEYWDLFMFQQQHKADLDYLSMMLGVDL